METADLQKQWTEFGRRDFNRGAYFPPFSGLNPARLAYIKGWGKQQQYYQGWIDAGTTP